MRPGPHGLPLAPFFPLLLAVTARAQDPAPGISLELARHRARTVGQIDYELRFDLVQGMKEVAGEVAIRFSLAEPRKPFVLDFAGSGLTAATLNDETLAAAEVRRVHDHLVIETARAGTRNRFTARFTSKVAATATPLTVYHDAAGGGDYLYTLLVPADAHRLFPCFDQPDLKATFRLSLTTPRDWVALTNAPLAKPAAPTAGGRLAWRFRGTELLPTYLFAFAAGPFAVLDGPVADFSVPGRPDSKRPLRIFVRAAKKARLDADRVFAMHLDSLRWYERYFARRYPFAKLDLVLCPGFPYGGMEHAGAIFYRESRVVFDHEPTPVEKLGRSLLVYHEVAHQWFGNLVTMLWFDDLWLKEGFATFMAYRVLDALEPGRRAWLRFHQRVKPAAYRVDSTPGTVPIRQSLANLDDAKSNYGPIVYDKAPAVLRELEQRIGKDRFRDGVRVFVQRFPYASASWKHLLASFEAAGARGLDPWSKKWILSKGMPRVRARWETGSDGRVRSFEVVQSSAQGWPAGPWPLRLELLARIPGSPPLRTTVTCDRAAAPVPDLVGRKAPTWVLLEPGDIAYGQFLLDPQTARVLPALLIDPHTRFADPLLRAVAFRALHETARAGDLDPARLTQVGLALLRDERDPLTFASLLDTTTTVISRWLTGDARHAWRNRLERQLHRQLAHGDLAGFELDAFRRLARFGKSDPTLTLCRALLDGKSPVPHLALGTRDRFLAAAALLAAAAPDAKQRLTKLAATATGDIARYAYQARAAAPDPATKADSFQTFLAPNGPPEQWVAGSLPFFHWPGQQKLTLPYLRRALDAAEDLKATRKIFFMPTWIDAFVNAHSSPAALAITDAFLHDHPHLPADIRRKLLQSADALRHAVQIRARRF